jgi:hypothetical protein
VSNQDRRQTDRAKFYLSNPLSDSTLSERRCNLRAKPGACGIWQEHCSAKTVWV